MRSYNKINNLLGWIIFAIASFVYLSTAAPTASFWDCGEYIATAYKLQVGHPPGAPLFQMIGRFFSLFAFGDTRQVAFMVNSMSALSSSFTILFLFWTLTMLGKKLAMRNGEITEGNKIAIFGSAVVGSLAYTFTDSFWFSAVEGEVYAMSSFFTALVFWAILKWDENADHKHSFRWLIFIAFMMGLSIGVHLLNLLAIPAITMVYYFRKYPKPNVKGMGMAFIISIVLLALIMNGIIPWIVKLAGGFELFFVNSIGMPFNSGTIIYFVLLIAGITLGIYFTRKKQKVIWNTVLWAFTFILIGYSSFFMLVIRSNANPPIDENNPEDAIGLLAYLNREQYGDWPVFHGPYFNAPVIDRKDGNPVYHKDVEKGKYVVINENEGTVPVYDPKFTTFFPRMWDNTDRLYINNYKKWSDFKGIKITTTDEYGETKTLYKPTFGENLRFFFRYQLNHMYFRYFMWNFSGRQDDKQGTVDHKNGNWITGIPFIDNARLGPVLDVPPSLKSKAQNKFYVLPFLLGLIGLIYQWRKDAHNALVVSLLFIMTGIAIVVYLNQHSPQPRERDYAYAASFYAFAIWIGLGVYALFALLSRKLNARITAFAVTGITLVLVPGIMAKEGWDDHDRSDRYTALAMANNYLNSCAPNAILFTNGDNDTFPLWYAQEVEGIRTDVRVVNLSLLNTEWYIEQMLRKAYDSDPVPFSLPWSLFKDGTHNFTYFVENENIKDYVELSKLFFIIINNPERLTMQTRFGPIEYLPTKKFKITVDSAQVIRTGTLPLERADEMVDEIKWTMKGSGVGKNHLMVLDLLSANNWERPVYFAITTGSSAYIGLEDYFQIEGMTYRLVPVKSIRSDAMTGKTQTDVMYDHLMNKYRFGNMQDPNVFLDETSERMATNIRSNFSRLAAALAEEGHIDSARRVIDRCLEILPDNKLPFNYFALSLGETCYAIGDLDKGNDIFTKITTNLENQLAWYYEFKGDKAKVYDRDKKQHMAILNHINQLAVQYKQTDVADRAGTIFDKFFDLKSRK